MEILNYSLWFTLGVHFSATIGILLTKKIDNFRVSFVTIVPPLIAILLEYLIVR